MSCFGILRDHHINESVQQEFFSFTNIMNEFKKPEIKRNFLSFIFILHAAIW